MPRRRDAKSILDLLTSPNPKITHPPPKNKKNTKHLDWFFPKQIKEWEEFKNLDIFTNSIVGDLLREAKKKRKLSFPLLNEAIDCVVYQEKDTERFFDTWNRGIVSEALLPVQQLYNPAVWVKGKNPKTTWWPPRARSLPERTPPSRRCSSENRKPKKRPMRINPDSGSSPYREVVAGSTPAPEQGDERFPKEYKPATKWKSRWIAEHRLVDQSGKWESGKVTDNASLPIHQAYTYCVLNMCRYGAILTCEEAFLFRIKPLDSEPSSSDDISLQKSLKDNGLMEYASIPWDNTAPAGSKQPEKWTVNLALWFMHILAGNNFRVGWGYGLEDELRLGALHVSQWNSSSPATQKQGQSGTESSAPDILSGELSSDDSDSGHAQATELTKEVLLQRCLLDSVAVREDVGETESSTSEEEITWPSLDDSPFRKRKRDEDAPNWSFSSKRSSRR